ncbi:hypothetical protein B0A62_06195 [Flavobacterium hydatis]|uniref:SprT-like domain-containing protein n=1 Tax=Flavobacterium hydatis TaxID=991 RepID=A0A086ANZ9_FLAHY|nr:hypothetical protein IW20_05820 [Flavobacterium hydatis]OXA96839.1 hypothetical protein B0A62_06195 [Flavobacterium hydatis]
MGCETEKLVIDEQTPQGKSILAAKIWFDQYKSNGINYELFQNLKYNWSEAKSTKSEDGTETIIVPVIELKEDKEEIWSQKLYLYKLNEGNFKALLFEIYPDKNVPSGSQTIEEGDFNGYMAAWDLKTGFVRASRFKNNQVVENGILTVRSSDEINKEGAVTNKIAPVFFVISYEDDGKISGSPETEPDPIDLREVPVKGKPKPISQGSPVVISPRSPVTGGTSPGGFTSPGGGSSGGGSTSIAISIVEQIITDDNLEPCPKEVLEQLKKIANVDIAAVLNKLGSSKVFTVTIESSSLIPRSAAASPSGLNKYNIKISSNYTSATRLFRASNLLHEMIHCYFFSLVDDYTASNNPAIFNDFPTLFQKFVDKKYPGSKDSAHHDEMANTYVNAIGAALQEFQTGSPVPNGGVPDQIYTDLAWGGLQEAPIFKTKFPEGSLEYNRIVGRYNGESVNSVINGQIPVGKPCTIN